MSDNVDIVSQWHLVFDSDHQVSIQATHGQIKSLLAGGVPADVTKMGSNSLVVINPAQVLYAELIPSEQSQ